MKEFEWLTCEDVHEMGTEITVKQASLVSAAIRSNGLLCELPNPNSMCIHYWHEGGCHGMSFHKKSQPLVCNLIREVVGNPFRPVVLTAYEKYECKVCGAIPGDYGEISHGRGCYVLDADGGGSEYAREIAASWLTDSVHAFAETIIETSDYDSVDVLADMLEEAGCDNEEILRHLRGEVRCPKCHKYGILPDNECQGYIPKPIPCQPGCWVLRLLTENPTPPDQSVTFRAGEIEG